MLRISEYKHRAKHIAFGVTLIFLSFKPAQHLSTGLTHLNTQPHLTATLGTRMRVLN